MGFQRLARLFVQIHVRCMKGNENTFRFPSKYSASSFFNCVKVDFLRVASLRSAVLQINDLF
ncbi:hypothetical protein CS542_10790 [Pedobacter sp. IW39]|nr:hypothetical protein CS542_10790 [Pedobacter sp. IW39]